jgi:NAD(P)-dependent dehydrogenase (short-subunit alcohol dehydrogenase family)
MSDQFAGRTAIVTAADSGMCEADAKRLATDE